ncbi:MAG: NTP transferase domain-containing protein [Firmicutes bacterium]|nr:NTP transferase domain-containing protein [Bacillota bacterium]
MQLVILAAGHGKRFGGLKQITPVGPHGEAIMDFTATRAEESGFDGIVVVIRDEIRHEIVSHVKQKWPGTLPVAFVSQSKRPGTAEALNAARPALDGAFGVANADDLYSVNALKAVVDYFRPSPQLLKKASTQSRELHWDSSGSGKHLLVAHHLTQTILTNHVVTRGICEVSDSKLVKIVEHLIKLRPDGFFDASELGTGHIPQDDPKRKWRKLTGREPVSMNLWGFSLEIVDFVAEQLARFDFGDLSKREPLVPDIVASLIAKEGHCVDVVDVADRCIGLTHPSDAVIVKEEIASQLIPEQTGEFE